MATFAGHIDEGIVFIIVALWWLYNTNRDYFKSLDDGKPYRSRVSYPTMIRGRAVHLEIFFKIAFPFFGFISEELRFGLRWVNERGEFQHHSSMQHMTIYAFFAVHGVSDLIDYLRLSSVREIKYLTGTLAFVWYGGAFYFHSSPDTGKPPLELIVHRLPVVVMLITAVTYFLEMLRRDLMVLQLVRCYTVLTFGTWFSYIPFILFDPSSFPGSHPNPAWDRNNMGNAHFMITAFGIHFILNLVIVMTSFYVMEAYRKCAKRVSGFRQRETSHEYEKVKLMDAEDPESRDDEF